MTRVTDDVITNIKRSKIKVIRLYQPETQIAFNSKSKVIPLLPLFMLCGSRAIIISVLTQHGGALLDSGFQLSVWLSGNALALHGESPGSRHSVGYILFYFFLLEQYSKNV